MITHVKQNLAGLSGKNILTMAEFSRQDIYGLIEVALSMKRQKEKYATKLAGRTLGMIFEKPSTRTRVSFEVGMTQLGGHAINLNERELQLGRGESLADTARVLSRYVDFLLIRTYAHKKVEELARYASVPVVNGLSDDYHPCQVLADLLTIYERFGELKGKTLVFVGDGNNMAHSLMLGAAIVGMNIVVVTPQGYEPRKTVQRKANEIAVRQGATVRVVNELFAAVQEADIIYTDVWTSMGTEADEGRKKHFAHYQINENVMEKTPSRAIFMHCLPAHRGEEVTDAVCDGPQSVIFDQAENRLHAQKALLCALGGALAD